MARPVITDKPILDQAEFNGVTIWRKEGGSIEVSDTNYPSMRAALLDIAQKAGIEVEEGWNTQYLGWYLIQQLKKSGSPQQDSAASAPKDVQAAEPKDVKADEPKDVKAAEPKAETKPSKFATDKELEKSVEGSSADIAGARVRVYGKAQNRTALGIMHAYMTMYPQAKMEDLQKAFPDSLNPDCGVKRNFAFSDEKGNAASWFFMGEDELLTMGDGKKVAVVTMWTKASFQRLAAWARQYGIIIADFEGAGKGGAKGGFRLEYLNGYVPPKPKKGVPGWLWAIIAAIILGLLALLVFGRKDAEVVEKVVVVRDTLYVQQIEEIEKNFNAAEFVVGKADLSDNAKFVLHDLAKVLNKNPELRLRLEGHTSADGDAALNQELSEARAQAAVTFLVEHEGVDKSRLEAVGYGSSRPKNEADPYAPENRRTEFIVIE